MDLETCKATGPGSLRPSLKGEGLGPSVSFVALTHLKWHSVQIVGLKFVSRRRRTLALTLRIPEPEHNWLEHLKTVSAFMGSTLLAE